LLYQITGDIQGDGRCGFVCVRARFLLFSNMYRRVFLVCRLAITSSSVPATTPRRGATRLWYTEACRSLIALVETRCHQELALIALCLSHLSTQHVQRKSYATVDNTHLIFYVRCCAAVLETDFTSNVAARRWTPYWSSMRISLWM
jgi:hypothetical protein